VTWWVWIVAGLVFALLEMVAPAWVFLGFAVGATGVGLLLLIGGPFAVVIADSWALALLVFTLFSVAAWAGLRRALGVRRGQVRHIEKDINDD
jgi:inner membrane protein